MITEIKINNFKSVQELTLPLGRFNVLIGANGSGKSNILEAIAFGGAASADKLDNEFLGSRGIRTASAKLMKSAFLKENPPMSISVGFSGESIKVELSINQDSGPVLKWKTIEELELDNNLNSLAYAYHKKKTGVRVGDFDLSEFFKRLMQEEIDENKEEQKGFNKVRKILTESKVLDQVQRVDNFHIWISNFIIYSPEISSLRKFEEESQIQPLGVKGEGLFYVLQVFYENYGEETINELRKYLHVIEWFDDFEAVFDKVSGRSSLVVKDRHMPDVTLNQHNVNEGFLFLLFYISLIISKETPAFFAIDNIEASFHPKLCEELIRNLVALAKKHDKQIILTTHNPFVLDGLDLNDPEQKLFVVRRNADGETIADSIDKAPSKIKLSEAWMRGYIGGQPETIE